MQKQIHCDSAQHRHTARELLMFHLGSLESLVDKIDMSIDSTQDRGGSLLYRCRVVITDIRSQKLRVVESQADFALAVNRALGRIVRSLMRRLYGQYSYRSL